MLPTHPLIKICGICDPKIAAQAILAGAYYIGLVFYPNSSRHVDVKLARSISKTVKEQGGVPVAIFCDQNADEMEYICQKTDISTLQLHGDRAREEHHLLNESYQRIHVCSVLPECELLPVYLGECFKAFIPERDLILFDYYIPGSGESFCWNSLTCLSSEFRFGVAGGLTSQNVETAIKLLKPTFVDVSTGVERLKGVKDIGLISDFIQAVKRSFSYG